MSLGDKIRFYRKKKGLMQSELGDFLFVTRQTVSLWEKGQTVPSIDNLIRLSEIFGVSIDHLVNDKDPTPEDTDESEDKDSEDANAVSEVSNSQNDNNSLQNGKNSLVFCISIGVIATMIVAFVISIFAMNVSISDKRIEKILGTELPEYGVRMVSNQRKTQGRVKIRAITELSFDEDVSEKLGVGMNPDMPDGIEEIIASSFAYQDAELYLLYDFDKACAAESCTAAGSYVIMAYYADVNILRITEFTYK